MNHFSDMDFPVDAIHYLIMKIPDDFDMVIQRFPGLMPLIEGSGSVAKKIFRIGFGPVQGKTSRFPGIADIGKRSDHEIPDESRPDFRDPDPAASSVSPGPYAVQRSCHPIQWSGLPERFGSDKSQTLKGFSRSFRNIELLGADARPMPIQHFIAVQPVGQILIGDDDRVIFDKGGGPRNMIRMTVSIDDVFYWSFDSFRSLGCGSVADQSIDQHHPFFGIDPGASGNGQRSHMNIRQGIGKYHFLPGKYLLRFYLLNWFPSFDLSAWSSF